MKEKLSKLKRIFLEYNRLITLVVICILIITIILVSKFSALAPAELPEVDSDKKLQVNVVRVGDQIVYTKALAKVENKNQINVSALSSGVANDVISIGKEVKKGDTLAVLTDTYSGKVFYDDQIAAGKKQVDIAEEQTEIAKENQDAIKDEEDAIKKQGDINKDREDIAELQLGDYKELQKINSERLDTIDQQIQTLEGNITSAEQTIEDIEEIIDDFEDFENEIEDVEDDFTREQLLLQNNATILNYKQSIEQHRQSIQQSRNTIEQLTDEKAILQYQTGSNYPVEEINEINLEILKQQIELEEERQNDQIKTQKKVADLNIDIANLNEDIAELNLSALRTQKEIKTVKAPIAGTIEKVNIKEGESASPGQVLFILNGKSDIELTVNVTEEVKNLIAEDKDAIIQIANETYEAEISFVSTTTNESGFYTVILAVSSSGLKDQISIGSSVEVNLPVKQEISEEEKSIFIPIDSVFKTNISEYVLVAEGEFAVKKEIRTGEVIGDQIQILEGLEEGDLIINDRRVIQGQKVEIENLEEIDNQEDDENQEEEIEEPESGEEKV